MVPPHEVVLEFDYALDLVGIVLLQKEKELCLNSGLIVVLLLVLYHLNCDHLSRFMILTLEDLAKRALANKFDEFETVTYLVAGNYSIVALIVVEAVIDKTFELCRCILLISLR